MTQQQIIDCHKLKKKGTALTKAPYPGPLGQKILATISAEAWTQWLEQQTILINEHRLSMLDLNARHILEKAMIEFLFESDPVN